MAVDVDLTCPGFNAMHVLQLLLIALSYLASDLYWQLHEQLQQFEMWSSCECAFCSCAQVAQKLLEQPQLCGLSGPTISPIFNKQDDGSIGECGYFDCTICVPKKEIYAAVKGVRQARAVQSP